VQDPTSGWRLCRTDQKVARSDAILGNDGRATHLSCR
jgi:hypothetical protein